MKLYKEAIEIEDTNLKKQNWKNIQECTRSREEKLGKKDYSGSIGKKTPDFVIMYTGMFPYTCLLVI